MGLQTNSNISSAEMFIPNVDSDQGVRGFRSAEGQSFAKDQIDAQDLRDASATDEKRDQASGKLLSKTFNIKGKVVTLSGDEIREIMSKDVLM